MSSSQRMEFLKRAVAKAVGGGLELAAQQAHQASRAIHQERNSERKVLRALKAGGLRFILDLELTRLLGAFAAPIWTAAQALTSDGNLPRWRILVTDQPSVVNAVALPAGGIMLDSGLLHAVADDAELAGVIAHESAHVRLHHGSLQTSWDRTLDAESLLGRLGPAPWTGLLAKHACKKVLLAWGSRRHEKEADRCAVRLVRAAGLDAMGLARFLGAIADEPPERPLDRLYAQATASHPYAALRRTAISRQVEEEQLQGGTRDRGAVAAIQTRLAALAGRSRPGR